MTLLDHLAVLEQLLPFACLLNRDGTLLPTNFVAFSYLPILKSCIPKESTWSWNQSNIKINAVLDEHTTITLKKISPRKLANGTGSNPSFKVWIYEIIKNNNKLYFLWCEKGQGFPFQIAPIFDQTQVMVANGLETPIGTIFPQQLSLQSLSFLKDFVEHTDVALELGW